MLDRLTLDQLRIFVAVAEAGTFSGAARRFGRVQSAVSQSVQTLETALGATLFSREAKTPALTETGRALLDDARRLIAAADTLRARAESIAGGLESELTLAVDAIFPRLPLMDSLRALSAEFPNLPVTLFTEGLGGPEQRLRDRAVRLAISGVYTGTAGIEAEHLVQIPMIPVVAPTHPLAALRPPLTRDQLEPQVQLVLTDRTPLTQNTAGGIHSRHIWRFADLNTRLDYLLAGFGWCHMPQHLVEEHIAGGRLTRLSLREQDGVVLPVRVLHERGRQPGRAGQWFLARLRANLAERSFPVP